MYPNSLCEIPNQSKKSHYLNFWNKYWSFCPCFEIEMIHNVEYDYDNKLFLPK